MTTELTTEKSVIEAPAPGIYYDIPAFQYFKWDAVNASFLKHMAKSASHARFNADVHSEPTPAMLQGSVCHTQLFEPDQIAKRYVVAGECSGVTGKGAACTNQGKILSGGVWYCGVHGRGRSWDDLPVVADEECSESPAIITQEMIKNAQAMAIRARWDNKIREILVGAKFEVCIVWIDPVTEILCKARLDVYRPDTCQIADLKTCEDASEDGFSRTIGDLGYDIQAAFYLDAATSIAGELHDDFIFIAQEKTPPYVAAAWRLHQDAIGLGRHRYRKLLADYKWCRDNNLWPGYHDHQIAVINVTRYFFEKEKAK